MPRIDPPIVRPQDQVCALFTEPSSPFSYGLNVDCTTNSRFFRVTVPASEVWAVSRVLVSMVDGAMGPGKFGGVTAPASGDGILIRMCDSDGTIVKNYTNSWTLRMNQQWNLLAGSDVQTIPAAGDDGLAVRWTLSRGVGDAEVEMRPGMYMEIVMSSGTDFSALTLFEVALQARRYPNLTHL